jgi:hypothetical protein
VSGQTRSSVLTTVGVAASVVGLTVTQPLLSTVAPVALAALIVEGSSTNPSGDGIERFFQGKFQPVPTVYVNFLTGPFGIWQALTQYPENTDNPENTVMSSGWGAANASLMISYLKATDPNNPALTDTTWVLDNNVANSNGGFGTRYPLFALIGVNPIPTPTDPGSTVISTAYEYDINGNAPKYILNPFADANSLLAYFDRRLTQADLTLPADETTGDLACDSSNNCTIDKVDGDVTYVTFSDGTTARFEKVDGVTYVGYETDGLPLVQPLRQMGEPGNAVADAIEPAMTALVNWGYPDNDPLANPGTLEPAGLFPTVAEDKKFVHDFAAGIQAGVASVSGYKMTLADKQVVQDTQDGQAVQDMQDGQAVQDKQDGQAVQDKQDGQAVQDKQDGQAVQDKQDGQAVQDKQDGQDVKAAAHKVHYRPILNALRTLPKFTPGETKPTVDKSHPPRPVAISVKTAVDRLTKAFAPKHQHESPDGQSTSAPGD